MKSGMRATSAAAWKAARELMGALADRRLLSTRETARLIGRGLDTVYALIDSGELDAHTMGRNRKVQRYTITARSVALLLCDSALYDAESFNDRVKALIQRLSRDELAVVASQAQERMSRLS